MNIAVRKLDPALAFLDDGADVSVGLRSLWLASDATCWLCGKLVLLSEATRDHRIPRSEGGTRKRSNTRLAHRRCNEERGDNAPSPDAQHRPKPNWRGLTWQRAGGVGQSERDPRKYNTVAKIWRRDRGFCFGCGTPVPVEEAERFLLVPSHLGGRWSLDNLRIVHPACRKQARIALKERETKTTT